jgi:diguanylate cyclase (GGDEF)-like protein
LNVDGFKEFNDFYGIKIGDFILKESANLLASSVKGKPIKIYRMHSDEFAVHSSYNYTIEEYKKIIFDLVETLEKHNYSINDQTFNITFTAGMTVGSGTGVLLGQADIALKVAKKRTLISSML